jgi:hypothetical protein
MTAARSSGQATRRAPKHGLNVLKKAVKSLGGRVIDQRTTLGKALAQWRKELIEDLGGPEAVSTQKQALIELAVRTKLLLDSIDTWLLKQPSLVNARRRAVLPVVLQRQHLAESLARSLTQLGLERRTKTTAAEGGGPAPASSSFEKLVEKLLPLGQEDFIKALDALKLGTGDEPQASLESENTPEEGTQTINEHDGRTTNQHSISTDGPPLVTAHAGPTLEDKVGTLEAAIRRLGKAWGKRASVRERRVGQTEGDSPRMTTLELALEKEIRLAADEMTKIAMELDSPEKSFYLKLALRLRPGGDSVPGEPPRPVSTEPDTSPPVLILPDTMQEVFRLFQEFGFLGSKFYGRGIDVRVFPREQAPGY